MKLECLFCIRMEKNADDDSLPSDEINFEVKIETSIAQVYKSLQKFLQAYKDEKKGPTLVAVQSTLDVGELQSNISGLVDFPQVQIHVQVHYFVSFFLDFVLK